MKALVLSILLSLCIACSQGPTEVQISGNTMGTQFNVTLANSDADVEFLQQEIEASLDAVDRMMSTYKADSEISRFSSSATTDWQKVSPDFCASVENALVLNHPPTRTSKKCSARLGTSICRRTARNPR
jgi:thiamine biosynthesis lipoprotein